MLVAMLTDDGRCRATTMKISGGGTPGALATVIASGPAVVASNVGDDVVLDYDCEPVRIRITALESASKVFGYPSRALTAADLSPTAWALAVDTISGLDHLEGMTVRAAGDGYDLGEYVVVGGSVTLEQPAVLVHVGLPSEADSEWRALIGRAH